MHQNHLFGLGPMDDNATGSLPSGPFYQHGLTLIPAWINNYTLHDVWDEITYPFLNFNDATVNA